MPQLDFTTYSSQIFWLIICFTTLYFFASKIILPRIAQIISERDSIIDADLEKANKLEEKISELNSKNEKLKKDANHKYQLKIEEALKQASKEREKIIEDLKNKLDSMAEKSKKDITDFLAKSSSKREESVENLVKLIKEKTLS